MIKISIIIPVYNMDAYLDECLESVVSQTLREIEILCVNDGSTDRSYQKLMSWAEKDSRLRIFNLNHQGVAVARNTAIKEARGEFVAFMDADDRYPENRVLEKMYEAAIKYGVNIAGGCFSDFDVNGRINTTYEGIYSGYIFRGSQVIDYREYQYDYGYTRFIYNRGFLLKHKIGFSNLIHYEDPPFMVQAMTLAKQFYAMTDVTYCYRINHKTIEWDQVRTFDLLCGLEQNLMWSKEHQLENLKRLTIRRMTEEYKGRILNQFELENAITKKYEAIAEKNRDFDAVRQMLIEGFRRIIKKKDEEINRIKKSYSYRSGRMLTYIPRKVRKCIEHKRSEICDSMI
ncbi:MAG: glycosyltransferase family 2 protein [Lachnospiraceae bacterium]|nr:glycosyltransferase family 2 protein [Lachnospiraceae bacterium]MDE7201241.1 glycosyltransferase family 2 protein [Lachnospiraceae bacterium]